MQIILLTYIECVKCFKHIRLIDNAPRTENLFVEPVNRLNLYMQKKSEFSFFFNPRIVFGTHFGQFENSLLLSDLKPPINSIAYS